MVPTLDMVNHSAAATAYYEEETSGDVSLRIRPGASVPVGEEINISYGDSKSAAEMLFSYGFIDPACKVRQLTLHLESFPDDPLAMAKQRIFGGAPVVTLRQTKTDGESIDGKLWESAFVYLMCLNEEDGLDFRILQDEAGDRQLRLFWQDEDVTGRAHDFETLLHDHPLHALFQLRAVSVIQERASNQLEKLQAAPSSDQLEPLIAAEIIDQAHVDVVSTLKDMEHCVLAAVVAELEEEVRTDHPSSDSDEIGQTAFLALFPPNPLHMHACKPLFAILFFLPFIYLRGRKLTRCHWRLVQLEIPAC